jgi:hypothetical protein
MEKDPLQDYGKGNKRPNLHSAEVERNAKR